MGFYKLYRNNIDAFFNRQHKKDDVCVYEKEHFIWNDVVDLANQYNVTVQYISKDVDRTTHYLSNGNAFYVTGRIISNPDLVKKEEVSMLFDPALLDV